MAETLVLQNATIFDSTGKDPYGPGTAVGPADQVAVPRDARFIDAGNHTVMPGLIDAHTHVGAVGNSFGANLEDNHPGAIYAFSVARILRDTLMSGFTTVRDAGGCDYSFKVAVQSGTIPGPRIFTSQSFISQTGGHGDMRQRHDRSDPRPGHRLAPHPSICDGVPQVRQAAREQLRTGADQLKIMAGGGAASPTDPLDSPQFTVEEIAAAVYEARAVKKKVMAHVYVPEGIKNCVEAGVRSIEHGNFLDEESASLMKASDMYLVPTLTVYEVIAERGREQGISESTIEKINFARGAGRQSMEIAMAAGVNIASGADLSGQNHGLKAVELELKAAVMGPLASLISATRTNAELLECSNEIGTLEPGKLADLIMVRGNPVDDISILQDEKIYRWWSRPAGSSNGRKRANTSSLTHARPQSGQEPMPYFSGILHSNPATATVGLSFKNCQTDASDVEKRPGGQTHGRPDNRHPFRRLHCHKSGGA